MLRINFSNLKLKDERQQQVLDRVREWVEQHPSATFLDPYRLSLELQDVPVRRLHEVLEFLVRQHILDIRFKAVSPYNHDLADPLFDSPLVDDEVRDTSENTFSTKEAEMVPVFVEASSYDED